MRIIETAKPITLDLALKAERERLEKWDNEAVIIIYTWSSISEVKKAWIYARKSEESDEKQIQSIEAQLEWCFGMNEKVEFEIAFVIFEAKSAKIPWKREWFIKMIEFYDKWIASINITWKLNRLSRNSLEEWSVKYFCEKFIIKEIHSIDWISNGHNILLMSVHFWMATQFSIDLSKDIKRWVKKKLTDWWWVRMTPLWYKMVQWEVELDEHYAPI